MKTEAEIKESLRRVGIEIHINCCVYDILDIENMLDRLLRGVRDKDVCNILLGVERALERLDLKPERLVADDGQEHYFIPKLHRALEGLKVKLPVRILRMGKPLHEIAQKGVSA